MPELTADSLEWVELPCDWCGSQSYEAVFSGPDRLEHLPGQFQIVRCGDCGLLRQHPHLTWSSLKHYYLETYVSHGLMSRDQPNKWRRLDKRYGPWKRLRAIESFQRGGSLLEVGCGTGTFLEEAVRSGGWLVTGVEPTPHAAEYVRDRLNIPVHQEVFSKVELPEASFDVIVMWNVLEHLENPIEDMRYAQRLLRPGGWFVFTVPNLEGWGQRLFGNCWIGWDLPRHLYFFSRSLLLQILPKLGFRWAGARCLSTSYHFLGNTLDFWSQSWHERHPTVRRALMAIYGSLSVRALATLPLGILDRLAQNTIITVFAQKI